MGNTSLKLYANCTGTLNSAHIFINMMYNGCMNFVTHTPYSSHTDRILVWHTYVILSYIWCHWVCISWSTEIHILVYTIFLTLSQPISLLFSMLLSLHPILHWVLPLLWVLSLYCAMSVLNSAAPPISLPLNPLFRCQFCSDQYSPILTLTISVLPVASLSTTRVLFIISLFSF